MVFCKNAMPCGQGRDRGQEKTEIGGHPSEMRFAVVNEFHRAGRAELGGWKKAER